MSRDITTEMQAVATDDVVRPFFMVDLYFSDSTLRMWTGFSTLIHNGRNYIGAGDLLNIGNFEENTELSAVGATLELNGVKTSLVQKARDENYQGKVATIKLGAFDQTGSIIPNPVTVFSGFMDIMTINEGAETSKITLTLENKLLQLERSNERRYTHEDHQIDHPDEKGFEFVNALQDKEIVWGRAG